MTEHHESLPYKAEDKLMKVLGLMGSPRVGGNTDILLDQVLEGAQSKKAQIQKLILSSYTIKPCIEIYACRKTGRCAIKDDFYKVVEEVLAADAIVLASPIFFYSLPSHTKALIDRCQALWCTKYLLHREEQLPIKKQRKGYFVSVGATKGKRLFDGVRMTVKYFFDTLDTLYIDELLIRGIDEKGEIYKHPTAIQDAFQLGEKIPMGSDPQGRTA